MSVEKIEDRAPSPAREGVYGDIAPGARITYAWATPLVVIGAFIVANIAAIAPVVAIVAAAAASGAAADDPGLMSVVMVVAILVSFPTIIAATLIWTRAVERRGLRSIGLGGPGWFGLYVRGLLIGLGLAVALMAAAALAHVGLGGEGAVEDDVVADWSRVASPVVIAVLVGSTLMFLMQGAAEEILFRGWMQSAVAARWTPVAGLILNSVVFGAAHLHFVFFAGWSVGMVAVGAVTAVGVFFSLWSLAERSIVGACGMHGAFNAALIGVTLTGLIATSDDGVGGALSEAFELQTGMDAQGASASDAFVQLMVFVVAAAFAALVWRRAAARRRAAQAGPWRAGGEG